MFDEMVTQDEMKFLRLLLKCDANISQEQKHLKTQLARKDFTDYVEVRTRNLTQRTLPVYVKCSLL